MRPSEGLGSLAGVCMLGLAGGQPAVTGVHLETLPRLTWLLLGASLMQAQMLELPGAGMRGAKRWLSGWFLGFF